MFYLKNVGLLLLFCWQISGYSQIVTGEIGTTFASPLELGKYSQSTICADIDNDGFNDMIIEQDGWGSHDTIVWYKNVGNFEFSDKKVIGPCSPSGYRTIRVGDMNMDGDMDVIAGYVESLVWYENLGDGFFLDGDTISTDVYGILSMSINDIDGDGDLDIVTGEYWGEKVAWYQNDGDANFGDKIVVFDDGEYVQDVDAADFDGDGDLDILRGAVLEPKIIWLENEDGTFEEAHEVEGFVNGLRDVHPVDFDGDGDIDIISASVTDGRIALFKNIGDGNFEEKIDMRQDFREHLWISEGDVDNDGMPDIFCNADVYDDYWNGIYWFEFDEVANFIKTNTLKHVAEGVGFEEFNAEILFYSLTLSDLDNDTDHDLVLCSSNLGILISENMLYTASTIENENDQFKLYYDPLNAEIVVSGVNENTQINSIRIHTIEGKEIFYSSEIQTNSSRVSMIDFNKQLVIVSVLSQEGTVQVKKFIIN